MSEAKVSKIVAVQSEATRYCHECPRGIPAGSYMFGVMREGSNTAFFECCFCTFKKLGYTVVDDTVRPAVCEVGKGLAVHSGVVGESVVGPKPCYAIVAECEAAYGEDAHLDNLRRYGFLSGSPVRSDAEEVEMIALRSTLRVAGVDPGWEPVARDTKANQ